MKEYKILVVVLTIYEKKRVNQVPHENINYHALKSHPHIVPSVYIYIYNSPKHSFIYLSKYSYVVIVINIDYFNKKFPKSFFLTPPH